MGWVIEPSSHLPQSPNRALTWAVPVQVLSTPFGQMIRPLLAGLEQQLASMRAQAFHRPQEPAGAGPEPTAWAAPPAATAAAEAPGAAPEAAPPEAPTQLAAAALAEGAPALAAAEVEIEAAIAGGMVVDAEQQLGHPPAQPAAEGQATEAIAAKQPLGMGQEKTWEEGAGANGAEVESKLVAELAVKAAYERLAADGRLGEHEALAQALEAVSPRRAGEAPQVVAAAAREPQEP